MPHLDCKTPLERWSYCIGTLWRTIPARIVESTFEVHIKREYSVNNSRYYHTLDHVMYILRQLDERIGTYSHAWELAAYLHDVATRIRIGVISELTITQGGVERFRQSSLSTPEIASANVLLWLYRDLDQFKDEREVYAPHIHATFYDAMAMILATQTASYARNQYADLKTQQFVDADMAILGDTPEVYAEYSANVRKEYPHVSDAEWIVGRSTFLKSVLDRGPIYFTREFADLETQARRNIQDELTRLQSL